MGHRIHFFTYNPTNKEVKVSKLLSSSVLQGSDGATKGVESNYTYESWTHQLLDYQTVYQVFYQYPIPEYNWSTLDQIITFNAELDSSYDGVLATKPKRLRFSLIPELVAGDNPSEGEAAYNAKFEKLIQFFKTRLKDKNKFQLKIEPKETPMDSKISTNIIRLWLPTPSNDNYNWVTLRYDSVASINRVYHLEVHWVACEAYLVDEFVNTLFIRCRNWQLRLVQIPEYFVTANLNIHPYRSQPYISLQSMLPQTMKSKYHRPLVHFIEWDYFQGQPSEWLEDNKQFTNWAELGLNDPKSESKDKEVRVNEQPAVALAAYGPNATNDAVAGHDDGIFLGGGPLERQSSTDTQVSALTEASCFLERTAGESGNTVGSQVQSSDPESRTVVIVEALTPVVADNSSPRAATPEGSATPATATPATPATPANTATPCGTGAATVTNDPYEISSASKAHCPRPKSGIISAGAITGEGIASKESLPRKTSALSQQIEKESNEAAAKKVSFLLSTIVEVGRTEQFGLNVCEYAGQRDCRRQNCQCKCSNQLADRNFDINSSYVCTTGKASRKIIQAQAKGARSAVLASSRICLCPLRSRRICVAEQSARPS
jgi:hypothetical protein